jgi:hypothetical protein
LRDHGYEVRTRRAPFSRSRPSLFVNPPSNPAHAFNEIADKVNHADMVLKDELIFNYYINEDSLPMRSLLSRRDRRPLITLLNHLLELAEEDRQTAGPHDRDRQFERWDDDSYIYLQSGPPRSSDRDIDISVHEGVCMIRVKKALPIPR